MKILKIFALGLFSLSLFTNQIANAEEKTAKSLGVDHFEVILPESAKVGEAVDLTIKVVDVNGEVIPKYDLPVLIFSTTDAMVELPISLTESRYTFKAEDQGVVTFENGVKFSKEGEQDLYVYDEYTDTTKEEGIGGGAKINIGDTTKNSLSGNINIVSPEGDMTITENKVKVSGNTEKNHQVVVLVNTKEYGTISDSNGNYEIEANELIDGENIIKAQILDSNNKIIGESNQITIKVEKTPIEFSEIKLIPKEVFADTVYEIELTATPGLSSVNVEINDEVIKLEEKEDKKGTYTQKASAPQDKGTYNANLTLKDETGGELKEFGVATLSVKSLNAPMTENTGATETGTVIELPKTTELKSPITVDDRDPLEITGLKLVELKTKSILTWDSLKKAEYYNIYKKNTEGNFDFITKVNEPKFEVDIDKGSEEKYDYFAVRAVGKTSSGEEYEGNLSDATRVKTGPEMIIILIISLILGAGLLMFKRKRT